MDKSNFNFQSSLEANYLNITLKEPVSMDVIAVKVIREDCPDFLLPFRVISRDDQTILKYRLRNTAALAYSGKSFRKEEFIKMYQAALEPFIKGADWLLDYHFICIDTQYVYISRDFSEMFYLYIPEYSYRNSDEEICRFFQNILDDIHITDDDSFLIPLYQYFHKGQIVLGELYDMLSKESRSLRENRSNIQNGNRDALRMYGVPGQSVYRETVARFVPAANGQSGMDFIVKPESAKESDNSDKEGKKKGFLGIGGDKTKQKQPGIPEEENPSPEAGNEIMDILFGEENKKPAKAKPAKRKQEKNGFGLFGKKKNAVPMQPTAQVEPRYQAEPGYQMEQPYYNMEASGMVQASDATEVLGENGDLTMSGCLELISSFQPGAPQRIPLNFTNDYITVGRQSGDVIQPDIRFGSEFRRIGRMHIRIEKNDGVFYVIDLGSANHTSLDGRLLIPNVPCPLQAGAELTFTPQYPVRYRVVL